MEYVYSGNIILAVLLFAIGALGVVWRRHAIAVFMCIELMLNAANLAFVTFAYSINDSMAAASGSKPLDGAIIALFVMTVAAAEAGVGLAIFLRVYRQRGTINLDEFTLLKD
ncbi:NADH-quinone oxidoreductase subunit NuoK [Candidatus Sumerlaeota bacterium]|nr:NADH-quinone oxidoreductase subunit NuoK [Candidatus Sumerlaeota bacterium]